MDTLPSTAVEPLLWSSLRAGHVSAWHGHVSFGHWLVDALRPRTIVELGTHNGVSFAAFCNAATRRGLTTRCFAVDSWKGDDHAGHYDESVYEDLHAFIAARFVHSATLVRSFFDQALPLFGAGSIDLLHIDGLHTYEAVRHDFEVWRPKLSDRAVVLFHDTVVRAKDFGVWRLWGELTQQYSGFNFHHSAGLGVLAVGNAVPESVARLCQAESSAQADPIRSLFVQASEAAHKGGLYEAEQATRRLLAAIQALGVNIALNRPAYQSSALPGHEPTPQGAVNGAKSGRYGFHTAAEPSPWWMVDLGSVECFDEVVVYNRLDSGCEHRSRSLVVLCSDNGEDWTELYAHAGPAFGGADGKPLRIARPGARARFIRLKLRQAECLHLDEVEIYLHAATAT